MEDYKKRAEDFTLAISKIFNKDSKGIYRSLIAIPKHGDGIIIKSEGFDVDLFDNSCFLEDNLSDFKNVPDKEGVYRCDIHATSYQCNHPQDPVEYDMDMWLENVEEIINFEI